MQPSDSGAAVENEDPAIGDDSQEQPKPETRVAVDEKPKAKAEPPAGSERWNEIYGKWKDTDRRLKERDQDVEAMREHNQKLEARLSQLEATKADRAPEPEPDPAIDPDAYKQWHEMKRLQERQELEKQRAVDRHQMQVDMQKELHPDYLDMIKIAERDMVKDPALKKAIWVDSGNAAKAAYEYGKKEQEKLVKKSEEEEAIQKAKAQTTTETSREGGESEAGEEDADKLSDAEMRVVRNLFPNDDKGREKYIKQKKSMGR